MDCLGIFGPVFLFLKIFLPMAGKRTKERKRYPFIFLVLEYFWRHSSSPVRYLPKGSSVYSRTELRDFCLCKKFVLYSP